MHRRVGDGFRQGARESGAAAEALYAAGQKELGVVERQALVYEQYRPPQRLVIEVPKGG